MSPLLHEKQTIPSLLLVTLRSLFKQLTLHSCPLGSFLQDPRSFSWLTSIYTLQSALQIVATELLLLCLDCHTDFLYVNVFVSTPQTQYKLLEDKEFLKSFVTQISSITMAIDEECSHQLPYLHKTFVH